jgi:hypothetical protein
MRWEHELDNLCSKLSLTIGCPIHTLPYGVVQCRCGVVFPLYLLKSGNWNLIKLRHIQEREMAKEAL